jgi:hypothetical protein
MKSLKLYRALPVGVVLDTYVANIEFRLRKFVREA